MNVDRRKEGQRRIDWFEGDCGVVRKEDKLIILKTHLHTARRNEVIESERGEWMDERRGDIKGQIRRWLLLWMLIVFVAINANGSRKKMNVPIEEESCADWKTRRSHTFTYTHTYTHTHTHTGVQRKQKRSNGAGYGADGERKRERGTQRERNRKSNAGKIGVEIGWAGSNRSVLVWWRRCWWLSGATD